MKKTLTLGVISVLLLSACSHFSAPKDINEASAKCTKVAEDKYPIKMETLKVKGGDDNFSFDSNKESRDYHYIECMKENGFSIRMIAG